MRGISSSRVQLNLPVPATNVEGCSLDQPTLAASRNSVASLLKSWALGTGVGSNAVAPIRAAGVRVRRCNSSFSRRRTSLQSPRFSVIAQTRRIVPPLLSAAPAPTREQNSSACVRNSAGRTSRNCPPPLVPRSIAESPSSESKARGSTSLNSETQYARPSISLAAERRNSSVPRILPCRKIWKDIRNTNLTR